jgi:integrase
MDRRLDNGDNDNSVSWPNPIDDDAMILVPALPPGKGSQPMKRTRHRNGGLRKRCECPRKVWPKCPHSWFLNFRPKGGPHYRLSLDREVDRHIDSKTEAIAEAERIRTAIRNRTFRAPPDPDPIVTASSLTFRGFARLWTEQRGTQLVRPRDNEYRLKAINSFVLSARNGLMFGNLALDQIRTGDIEAFRDARKADGISACTVNHDLKLLRKMFNWGIRRGYLERTPFKIGTEPAITLDREIPRDRRFQNDDDEQKLLDAVDPHLRAVIIALLDTACRLGEILSLQWRDVNLERRELTIQAMKAKTRTARIVPISTRLLSTLEMRKLDPAGREFEPNKYAFGNEIGEQVTSVRIAWETARATAGLPDLQLRDLRHEAGSRFDEAGVSTNYVSKILGHASLTTTTRYLNIQRRGLHLAMEKLEESQKLAAEERKRKAEKRQQHGVAQPLPAADESAPAFVLDQPTSPTRKQLPS